MLHHPPLALLACRPSQGVSTATVLSGGLLEAHTTTWGKSPEGQEGICPSEKER